MSGKQDHGQQQLAEAASASTDCGGSQEMEKNENLGVWLDHQEEEKCQARRSLGATEKSSTGERASA